MNASAAIRHPRREDYEPTVRAFLPGVDGEELQLRCSLLLMRDRAMAVKPICCEEAWALMDLMERTVSRDAFRPMPLEELRCIRAVLIKITSAAVDFDALWAPQLNLGEADARG